MSPRSRAAVLALLGLFGELSCSSSDTNHAGVDAGSGLSVAGAAGSVGASIAVIQGGATLAVVNPDQGSVSFLDPDSLADTKDVPVGGEPRALLELSDGRLLVTIHRGGQVVVVDEATLAVTQRISVCTGPYGLAASPDGSFVAVACEWDETVQKVDTATFAVSPIASGLHRPRAVAVVGDSVFVADSIGGFVHQFPAGGGEVTVSLVPSSAPYRPALTLMTANLTAALVPAFGSLFAAHALENNTGNSTLEPIADNYGDVTNTAPQINPSVTDLTQAGRPALYAEFNGGSRVYSGPVAVAPFGSHYLLVAHVSTANVAVLDTTATSPNARAVGTFAVGAGPSGIAVDAAHSRAFVDNFLDQSVSSISLNQSWAVGARMLPASATLVRSSPSPYSADALAGRRLLFDATNPHVTPSGVVACASCHPGGDDDGLVWFIHTPETLSSTDGRHTSATPRPRRPPSTGTASSRPWACSSRAP
jgi:YVTN family beta-propeller protein